MKTSKKQKSGKNRSRLSKNLGVDKGPQPLMFNPALTTCASERMKTLRFSYFAGFAARELMREAKPVKLKKVAFSHFFDTLKRQKPLFYAFTRLLGLYLRYQLRYKIQMVGGAQRIFYAVADALEGVAACFAVKMAVYHPLHAVFLEHLRKAA